MRAQTFSYKPALLGKRREVRVDEKGVETTLGERTQAARFDGVTGGRFVELYMRQSSVSLVLFHGGPDGDEWKFVLNLSGRAPDARHDANVAAFVKACVAILEAWAAKQPGAEIALGGGEGIRWLMAIVGVMFAGIGVMMVAIVFGEAMGIAERLLFLAASGATLFAAFGIVRSFNPLRRPPMVKVRELAARLRAHLPG